MNAKISRRKLCRALPVALALLLTLVAIALAAGNIDPTHKWAWGANMGWLNFAPDYGGVIVYSDHLEGHAWAENIGWIRLGTCTSGSPCTHANTSANNYGVNNDGVGNLSGYAWSASAGWINFAPSGGGVTIDPITGDFDGYAWGENVGWIHFHNADPAYKVNTAWPSGPTGNIDLTYRWAWGANVGWLDFAPYYGGVIVYADHLEGYAWAENVGWIRLGTCTGGSPCVHANTSANNYGVNNDGVGNLSGYAWSASAGWINFAPSGGGVTIDPITGDFDGYAWGENIGWIHFNNHTSYRVNTTWRSALTLNSIANADGDGNYTVAWSSISGATSCTLQEATNSTFTGATTAYSGSGTSTAISGKTPGTYYYRVRASNAGGDSAWSNTQAVVVVAPPGAPILNSIANADGDGNYSISWGFVDGATTYTLQEATSSSFADAATIYANGGTFTSVSNRTLGTYYYRVRATNVVGNSSWSNTRSVIVSVETGDAYEPDDTCAQAQSISSDGTVQERTFHKQADEDWVVFSVTAGLTYRIEAQVPLESPADVAVEVYDQCAGIPVDGQDHTFAAGVRLEFTASTTGLFYLKWFNHDPDIFGADVVYEISVRALATEAQPGAVIIVAGRYKYNDPLQPNIHYAASQIYQMFQNNGYPANRIYYLSTDLTQPGANALATVSHLQIAISTWALDKVNADRPLTLYLVDHGMPNQIYLDRPKGEAVTPTQLDTWLTQLETARPGLKVNIIMEACYSGSFIGLPQSLSKIGRVVVASTSATDVAYASVRGAVFSDYFSAALTQGASVYGAFESARGATRSGYPYQNPWLDANGNSIPNEAADAQIAALRGFAYAGTLSGDQWPPYIAQTTPVAVTAGRGNLRVEVRDDDAVRYVWAVIYPPSYTPPATQEELVQETLPTAMLLSQGNGWYGAQYTGFDEMGEYRVVFYAEDDLGLSAQPVAIMVQTGWAVYLPVVIKQ